MSGDDFQAAWNELVGAKAAVQTLLDGWGTMEKKFTQVSAALDARDKAFEAREKALVQQEESTEAAVKKAVAAKEAGLQKREATIERREEQMQQAIERHSSCADPEGEAVRSLSTAGLSSIELQKKVVSAELCETFDKGKAAESANKIAGIMTETRLGLNKDRLVNEMRNILREALELCSQPGAVVVQTLAQLKCFPNTGARAQALDTQMNTNRKAALTALECLRSGTGLPGRVTEDERAQARGMLTPWQNGMKGDRKLDGMDCYALVVFVCAFGLQADADKDVLLSALKELATRKQLVELVKELGLEDEETLRPIVAALLGDHKLTEAIHFVKGFGLSGYVPEDMAREMLVTAQTTEDALIVKQVLRCIKQHSLEGMAAEVAILEALKSKIGEPQRPAQSRKRSAPNNSSQHKPLGKQPRGSYAQHGTRGSPSSMGLGAGSLLGNSMGTGGYNAMGMGASYGQMGGISNPATFAHMLQGNAGGYSSGGRAPFT